MRILYITGELPYPLTTGFIRHYHFLKALGARHEITYLSLTRRREVSDETRDVLAAFARDIRIFGVPDPSEPSSIAQVARLPGVGRKLERTLRKRWAARRLKDEVGRLLEEDSFDVVFLSGKYTHPAADAVDGTPIVIDCCDATSLRIRGEIRNARLSRKLWLALRYLEMKHIQGKLVAKTPFLAFASERDRTEMVGSEKLGVLIPQAVDLTHWTRRSSEPEKDTVVFSGAMDYPPNHDAALRLINEVLPLVRQVIPDVKAYIVGRDPLPALEEAARPLPWVTVTGKPDDMRDYFERATVACAPLRFASGMQFKVLEALAMEVPMVTTSVAADGLWIDGQEPPLLVGADSAALADGVVRLLQDEDERRRVARAGRRFVEEHFSWDRSVEKLEELLLAAAGLPRRASAAPKSAASTA